jgi:hypothetical protein
MADLMKLDPEVETLARKIAREFKEMVDFYMRPADAGGLGLSREEALERVSEPRPEAREEVLTGPPDEVTWWQLERVAQEDGEAMLGAWDRITQAACDELSSGHRAAQAVVPNWESPWKTAQFLAVRAAFMEEWGEVGGTERMLVDTLAHAYTSYLDWLDTLTSYTKLHRRKTIRDDKWGPPTVSDAQTVEQAAAMVDRFNRIMLRTLRALRDLRRYAPSVTIQQAGQVNLGGQQLNVAVEKVGEEQQQGGSQCAGGKAPASEPRKPRRKRGTGTS